MILWKLLVNPLFNSFWFNDEVLIEGKIINVNTVTDWIYDEVVLVLIVVYPWEKVLIQFGSIEEMLNGCKRISGKLDYG